MRSYDSQLEPLGKSLDTARMHRAPFKLRSEVSVPFAPLLQLLLLRAPKPSL